jgi:hypothetical protein
MTASIRISNAPKFLGICFAALVMSVSGLSAQAAEQWDLTYQSGSHCCHSSLSFTGTQGTTVAARAYSRTGGTGNAKAIDDPNAMLGIWNGLGVINSSESNSAPNHSMDSDGWGDLIVFDFGPGLQFNPTGVGIGWTKDGGPGAVKLLVGGNAPFNFVGKSFNSLVNTFGFTNLGKKKVNHSNSSIGISTGATGRYLVVAAAKYRANGTRHNSYVKVNRLNGTSRSDVPEPLTLLMFLTGLIGLGALHRRSALAA